MGYKINILAGYKYERLTGLMKKYVEEFLKMKTCNGGVKTAEECEKLNEEHRRLGLDIVIQPEETTNNPGMKEIAKLCLNSLWGKFGQRANLDSYDFYDDKQYNQFINKLLSNKITTKGWEIVNENCVELHYNENNEDIIESNYISEITAIFTTANARIRLYSFLSWLHPSQIIYWDTDSCYFLYDKNNPLHKYPSNDAKDLPPNVRFGNALSCWEDEFKGSWAVEFVGAGAKSYAYKMQDGTVKMKQKGITLDVANRAKITYERFKEMVLNKDLIEKVKKTIRGEKSILVPSEIESVERFQFSWEKDKSVITKFIKKSIKSTVNDKRMVSGYDTYPYGYNMQQMEN
jgi:hypothetical protein